MIRAALPGDGGTWAPNADDAYHNWMSFTTSWDCCGWRTRRCTHTREVRAVIDGLHTRDVQ